MNILFDTNVALDVIEKRVPFYTELSQIAALAKKGYFTAYVSASAITDMYYLAGKLFGDNKIALKEIKRIYNGKAYRRRQRTV